MKVVEIVRILVYLELRGCVVSCVEWIFEIFVYVVWYEFCDFIGVFV